MEYSLSPREHYIRLKIVYYALLFTQISFSVIAFFYFTQKSPLVGEDLDYLKYLAIVVSILGLFSSHFIKERFCGEASRQGNLDAKIGKYKTASILNSGIIELTNFFNIFVFIQTGEFIPLILFGCLVIIFLLQFPTPNRISNEIKLTSSEEMKIFTKTAK
ncbi:hypothetical protein [Flexithrix dorotheae]|uniref:hypothetical protein n=1 Tax=Flexithrix dorotheae TaxID=70993 RepID=UPI000363E21B|nr:hypothetical protein [Flexithrix dorotheae]